ncbi:MAG: 30S ribosomal protein S14 [Microcystis sp. 53602_E8]|nr:30S ribosomal protein S14 [Microcystis sp. 53602_E8]
MAKKSMVEREKKRARLRQKYEAKRAELKEQFRTAEDFEEKLAIHQKLQELPRNSAPSRHRNRCLTTREWAHQGLLPGVVKSSW